MRARPLVMVTLAVIAAILCADGWSLSGGPWLAVAAATGLPLLLWFQWHRPTTWLAVLAWVSISFLLGLARYSLDNPRPTSPSGDERRCKVWTVAAPPAVFWDHVAVRARMLSGATDGAIASLRLPAATYTFEPGDAMYSCAAWHARQTLGNPADAQASRPGPLAPQAFAFLSNSAGAVPLLDIPPQLGFDRTRWHLARRVLAATDGEAGPVLLALLIGLADSIDREVRNDFAVTGTAHILSISGSHLAMLAVMVHLLLGRLLRRIAWLARRGAVEPLVVFLTLSICLWFTFWSGAPAPTVRSYLMLFSVLIARAWARRPDFSSALALAALLVLLGDPEQLWSPSFQLSFVAVAGLSWATPTNQWLTARLTPHLQAVRPWLRRTALGIVSLFWASIAASLATAPIGFYHFGATSWLGPLANLAIVPLVGFFIQPFGLLGLLLTWWFPSCADIWMAPAAWGTHWMLSIADVLAGIAPPVRWHPDTLVLVLLGICCFFFLRMIGGSRRLWWAFGISVGALCLAVLLQSHGPTLLRATFLNVEHGLAVLVQAPGGHSLLFDGGGRMDDDGKVGERLLLPNLAALDADRIEIMMVSHVHADHLNGLLAVARQLPVASLYLPVAPKAGPPELIRLAAIVHAHGGQVKVLAAGQKTVLSWPDIRLTLRRLAPSANDARLMRNPNNQALILEILHGRRRLWLTGDIEAAIEQDLVAQGLPHIDLLQAPHHGSATSSSPSFLAATVPRAVIVSRSREDAHRDPFPKAWQTYHGVGAQIFDIAAGGAATVETDGDLLSIRQSLPNSVRTSPIWGLP